MGTQTVEFRAATGRTLTAKVFLPGSDTVVQTASAVSEATNRLGTYTATFTDLPIAEYEIIGFSSSIPVARWMADVTAASGNFESYEKPAVYWSKTRAGYLDAAITSRMATYTQPTGFLAATFPATVSSYAGGAVASVTGSVGSISGVTFPSHFQNLEIAANGHVSAVVQSIANNSITASSIQGGAITAAKFAADAITASALAADAVTEIQSGLALAADLLIVSDRVSYSLTILAGACSDAQTAAETYTLTIGGNTFTVDYSGLDSSGNRSTTTLSKT